MHLGPKIFGVQKLYFWRSASKLMGTNFRGASFGISLGWRCKVTVFGAPYTLLGGPSASSLHGMNPESKVFQYKKSPNKFLNGQGAAGL